MTRSRIHAVGTLLIAIGASGCAIVQGYVATTVSGGDQGLFVVSAVLSAIVGLGAAAAAITRAVLARSSAA